ncbi:MAG TPA: hypothetical protein VM865_02725 [Acidobacteriaceae bacterium]|jgi:uncharacterized membrane protein|nr:hypothetical protein [Acidobacteriaceae bacterium]
MDMILLLGVVTGMRSMTAIAALCWAGWMGLVPEHGWAIWITYLVSAIIFTACALGEYVADTLPKTPSRTAPGPAIVRLIIGGLIGALVATAIYEPVAGGIILGSLGALIGTWGGYWMRMTAARMFGRDLPAAILESLSALVLAVVAIERLHHSIAFDLQRQAR